MALTVSIALLTVLAMIITVLIKPYVTVGKVKVGLYWIVCLFGAILMLVFGCIPFSQVIKGITADTSVNPLKILALFLSMTLLSIYLGDAGFFDFIADSVFLKTKGGQLKLFLVLYAVVSILTVFTSNDVIILTFTPPICIFAKKAKISPFPFLLGEFVSANTWSMMLVIGNPTNVYLAGASGITFLNYLSVMWLPAIVGGLTGLFVIFLLFRKQLALPLQNRTDTDNLEPVKVNKFLMVVALVHLLVCIILLAVSEFVGVQMWLICLALAISLTVFNLVYNLIRNHSVSPVLKTLKKAPYELIPFVLSMFVIVLSLKERGFTDLLNNALITSTRWDGLSFGFLSALSANLLNNIPMSVLFERIIDGLSIPALYGSIIGSNVGAFITPVGALAGIMWNKILSEHGVRLPFTRFVLYGVTVALPTLLTSTLTLVAVL